MEATTAALPTLTTTQQSNQSAAIRSNREEIERITYLASLVSRFEDVDPMMDTLRAVTASWDKSAPLNPQDLKKLQDLERDLKNYLITKDPVRAFTAESLEEQLNNRTRAVAVQRYGFLSPLGVLGASVLAAGVPFILPADWLSQHTRTLLAIPLFFAVLQVGISWLYLSALKNFQQEVRRAFQIMCVGIVLFALSFSHYAIITAFSLDDHPAFQYGGLPLLVALPFMFIFAGLRIYAKQLDTHSKIISLLMSWKFVAAAVAVVTILYLFVPFFRGPGNTNWYGDFSAISGAMLPLFSGMAAILTFKIRKAVTRAYARPLTGLFVYLVLIAGTSLYSNLSFGSGSLEGETPLYAIMAIGGVPMQLLLLWTGYSFKKELSK